MMAEADVRQIGISNETPVNIQTLGQDFGGIRGCDGGKEQKQKAKEPSGLFHG
jgi:hypothetical protein